MTKRANPWDRRWYDYVIGYGIILLFILLVIGFIMDPGNEPRTGGSSDCPEAQLADKADYPNC